MTLYLTIDSKPIPKARHRCRLIGRRIMTYDPQSSENAKVKKAIAKQMLDKGFQPILQGPLNINLDVYVAKPKALQKKTTKIYCDKRPDLDNYCKQVFDLLNGIAYKDDGQIACISARKCYDDNPRVDISISSIEGVCA